MRQSGDDLAFNWDGMRAHFPVELLAERDGVAGCVCVR